MGFDIGMFEDGVYRYTLKEHDDEPVDSEIACLQTDPFRHLQILANMSDLIKIN